MQIRVIRHIRKTYGCRGCEAAPVTADKPAQLIEKSLASPSLLATLLTAKYVDGLPLHRFENVLSRHGLELSRQTLAGRRRTPGLLGPCAAQVRRGAKGATQGQDRARRHRPGLDQQALRHRARPQGGERRSPAGRAAAAQRAAARAATRLAGENPAPGHRAECPGQGAELPGQQLEPPGALRRSRLFTDRQQRGRAGHP